MLLSGDRREGSSQQFRFRIEISIYAIMPHHFFIFDLVYLPKNNPTHSMPKTLSAVGAKTAGEYRGKSLHVPYLKQMLRVVKKQSVLSKP